ncbi:hypothetical protein K0U27_02680 [archaeon]|nr:hypothetical protein [archaeon]
MITLFDDTNETLSAEEINELEKQQSAYPARHSFAGGDMMFLEEWCEINDGLWKSMGTDRGECMFETKTQYHLASMILDDLKKPEITGKSAQEICRFLALECPQRASFDGHYQVDTDRTLVNYEYKGTMYRFDVSDEHPITFTINDSQEQFDLSENATLEDEFNIKVKTGYDYYTLGEKIGISGIVRDNHRILSQTDFEHPIILQITRDDTLIEVAQLEILRDGKFQHIVNTGGHMWKSGEYQIKTTYDRYVAINTFDIDKE